MLILNFLNLSPLDFTIAMFQSSIRNRPPGNHTSQIGIPVLPYSGTHSSVHETMDTHKKHPIFLTRTFFIENLLATGNELKCTIFPHPDSGKFHIIPHQFPDNAQANITQITDNQYYKKPLKCFASTLYYK